MKQIRALSVAIVVIFGVGLLAPPQASAYVAPTVQASADPLAFPGPNCQTTTVHLTGMTDDGYGHFYLIYVMDAAGTQVGYGDVPYDGSAADVPVSICPSYYDTVPGAWSIQIWDASTSLRTTVGSFQVTYPIISVRRHKKARIGTLTYNAQRLKRTRVAVEVAIAGEWHHIRYQRTNKRGKVGIECRRGKRCPWAFRFTYLDFVSSPAFLIQGGNRQASSQDDASVATVIASTR